MTIREIQDVRTRIQMAFMEMPELRLTRAQVRRLLSLSAEACEGALAALVQSGFLIESLDGAIARGTSTSAASLYRMSRPASRSN
jgi:S-adenosylhomocysteine hydrolase